MNASLLHAFGAISAGVQNFVPARWQPVIARRRALFGGAALVLVAVAVWYLFFSAPPAPPPRPAPPVRVATVVTRPITITESQIGTVVSVATVQVTAQVSGQLLSAEFTEGQIVHQGDVIFRIDPKPFVAALEQARAAYARDSATLGNAMKDKARYTALAATGAASAQQRDQATATADADAATVKSDKAAIDAAQLNLGYTTIRSPINGKTGPILVQPGNLVVANSATNPLVVITQLQPIKVSFFLPQADLPKLQDRLRAGKLTATVTIHGTTETNIEAPIDFIGNQVNAQTGTIELRATFGNADYRLVPGQLLDVKAAVADIPRALVVPREAVYLGPETHFVFVIDAKSRAQLRNVNLLFDDGTNDAIEGAVKPGDHVITEGQIRVTPGIPVTVVGTSQANTGQGNAPAPSTP